MHRTPIVIAPLCGTYRRAMPRPAPEIRLESIAPLHSNRACRRTSPRAMPFRITLPLHDTAPRMHIAHTVRLSRPPRYGAPIVFHRRASPSFAAVQLPLPALVLSAFQSHRLRIPLRAVYRLTVLCPPSVHSPPAAAAVYHHRVCRPASTAPHPYQKNRGSLTTSPVRISVFSFISRGRRLSSARCFRALPRSALP